MRFTIKEILNCLPEYDPNLLKQWAHRGLIKFSEKPQRGKAGLRTWAEGVTVAAMFHLSLSGRGPSVNIQIAELIAQRAAERPINEWIPDSLEEELDQCVLFYRIFKDNLQKYQFIKKRDINYETIGMAGSFFDCDYLLQRLAEELLHNKRNG